MKTGNQLQQGRRYVKAEYLMTGDIVEIGGKMVSVRSVEDFVGEPNVQIEWGTSDGSFTLYTEECRRDEEFCLLVSGKGRGY